MTAAGLPFQSVAAAPIVGVAPHKLPLHAARLLRGLIACMGLIGRRRPDAILVTGGYVSVPVAVAAWLRRVPLAVFLPDVVPGRAVALAAALADLIMVSREEATAVVKGRRVIVTGYPVRSAIRTARSDASRDHFGVPRRGNVLLVFGGSQGARRINEAVVAAAGPLLDDAWIIHVTGHLDHDMVVEARRGMGPKRAARWIVRSYLGDADMAAALAAADLAVSRAGAAVLGEFPARGLPAILVPLELAAGHQANNAAVLAGAGAAVVLDNAGLSGDVLAEAVGGLFSDPARRASMAAAAATLDEPGAAAAVWQGFAALASRDASLEGRAQ